MNRYLLLFTFPIFLYSTSLAQSPSPDVMFILDASGSMWQKLEGEFKVVIAKEVLKDLVANLPDDTRIGLIAYGHNREGDCGDIETLQVLSSGDRKFFMSKLESINPRGRTPIAKSIEHALSVLKNESGHVNCVLVSDGLETCEGNACDIIGSARNAGIPVTMHVIGFGLEEKDLSALECIAQAGGGQYLPANNAEELALALEKTMEETPTGGGYLSVEIRVNEQLVDGTVQVTRQGESDPLFTARTYAGPETNPRIVNLPPATYRLDVTAITLDGNPIQSFDDILIKSDDTLFKEVDFSKGSFEIKVTRNGTLSDATIVLYKKGTKEVAARGRSYTRTNTNPAKYEVPPGNYDIEIGSVEIGSKPKIIIGDQFLSGGGITALKHDFKSGELRVGAKQGSALIDATVAVLFSADNKEADRARTYTSEKSNPSTFTLEPGKYVVEVLPVRPRDLPMQSFEVEVIAGKSVERIAEW